MGNNHSFNPINVVTFKVFLVIVYNCGAHFFVFWLELFNLFVFNENYSYVWV